MTHSCLDCTVAAPPPPPPSSPPPSSHHPQHPGRAPHPHALFRAAPPLTASRRALCSAPIARTPPPQRLSEGLLRRAPAPAASSLAAFVGNPNSLGQTPLMTAASKGHVAVVYVLLGLGVSPWARDRGLATCLHYAGGAVGYSGGCVA
jgi:hypothetical protein